VLGFHKDGGVLDQLSDHWLIKEFLLNGVFKNRVLRRIFGPKREEETRGRGKLYNIEVHSSSIHQALSMAIKSRRMRWVKYVARVGGS
jgi:hypothetical protein